MLTTLFLVTFAFFFFFFNDTATTEIYTLSLHDALPISSTITRLLDIGVPRYLVASVIIGIIAQRRSEEHTSELQSRQYLVCRLLLEKKKKKRHRTNKRLRTTHHRDSKDE